MKFNLNTEYRQGILNTIKGIIHRKDVDDYMYDRFTRYHLCILFTYLLEDLNKEYKFVDDEIIENEFYNDYVSIAHFVLYELFEDVFGNYKVIKNYDEFLDYLENHFSNTLNDINVINSWKHVEEKAKELNLDMNSFKDEKFNSDIHKFADILEETYPNYTVTRYAGTYGKIEAAIYYEKLNYTRDVDAKLREAGWE